MAHGWDSYFHDVQPLSSDPGTLRRTSETEGTFPQHLENFLGHHDFSGTGVSQETPVPNSNSSTNYCTNRGIENSNSDCGYETYCNDAEWQADGEHLGKDYLQRCENRDFPDFATDGLPASGSFPSTFAPDLQGLKQDCEMLSMSCLGNYSDVSSCSDTDESETRPSCKFMGVNSFSRQNSSILSKDGSPESYSTETGNMTLQTDGVCPKMSETNVILPSHMKAEENLECVQNNMDDFKESVASYRGHTQPSTTSSVLTESENVHARDGCDSFQNQKPQGVKGDFKGSSSPGISVAENVTKDEINHYPVDKGEEDQSTLAAQDTFDNEQDHSNSVDDYMRNVSEEMHGKSVVLKRLKEEPDSLRNKNSDELQFPVSYSNTCEDKRVVTDCQKKRVQKKNSPSSSPSAIQVSKSKDTPHELDECTLGSNNHDIESGLKLPEHQSERVDQNNCGENLSKMSDEKSCLEPNKSSTDVPLYRDIKEVKTFTKKAERVKTASETNVAELSKPTELDCSGLSVCKDTGNVNDVDPNIYSDCSSPDIHLNLEVPISPIENKTPSRSPDPDCSSSVDCHSTIYEEDKKSATSHTDSCLQSNSSRTGTQPSLEMETSSQEEKTQNTSPDQDCGNPKVTCDSPSVHFNHLSSPAESCSQTGGSNTDMHPCKEMETSQKVAECQTHSQDPACSGDSVTHDSLSDNAADKKKESLIPKTEFQSQSHNSYTNISPRLSQESASPSTSKSTAWTNPEGDSKPAVTSCVPNHLKSSSHQIGSSTGMTSHSDAEWTNAGQNTNSVSFPDENQSLHDGPMSQEPQSPTGEDFKNTGDSFEHLHSSTEDQSLSGILFGEPLSEDSSCDADEANLVSSQYKETLIHPNKDDMSHLEDYVPRLQSSLGMRKLLHPVVILNSMESTNGTSHLYQCKDCQNTAHNADLLIEHHYYSHPMLNFKFCKTCNVYLLRNGQNKRHFCGASKDELPHKKRRFFGRHKCAKCGLVFSKILHYIKHMRGHTGQTPFRCNGCGLYFAQPGTLQRHQRIAGRCKSSQLPVTNSATATSKTEVQPQKDVAQNIPDENMRTCYVKLLDISNKNLCHFCGKMFKTVQKAKKHMYAVHKKKRAALLSNQCANGNSGSIPNVENNTSGRFKCPLCPRVFKHFYNRSRHLRDCARNAIYGGKLKVGDKYLCPLCKAGFTATSNRYRHVKGVCLRECLKHLAKEKAKSYPEADQENTEENDQNPQSQETVKTLRKKSPNPALSAPKPAPCYKCSLCPAFFRHPSGKYRHMKKHELFKLTGKMFRYKNSVSSVMPKPETSSCTKTGESADQLKPPQESPSPSLSCRFCGKSFDVYKMLKKHERNHRGERPYRCLDCKKGFKQHAHLISHKMVHQKRIQCTVCKKVLPTVGELIQHRRSHLNRGKLQCPECQVLFQYPAFLLRHLKTHRNKEKKLRKAEKERPLKLGQSSEKPLQSLEKPLQSLEKPLQSLEKPLQSLEKPLQSTENPLQSSEKPLLSSEKSLLQSPPKSPQLSSEKSLQLSLQKLPLRSSGTTKNETGSAMVQCSLCKEVFDDAQILRKHCLTHISASASNQCPFCNIKLADRRCVLRHMVRHTGDKPFSCDNCGKQFYRSIYLKLHHQKCLPHLITCGVKTKDKMRAYCCSVCPRAFFKKDRWQRHLEAHKKKSLIICPKCGQYFGVNMVGKHKSLCGVTPELPKNDTLTTSIPKERSLKTNKNEHEIPPQSNKTKKSQFKCPYCTHWFRFRSLFLRHLISHTGVQPYACVHCGQRYGSQTMCLQHEVFCEGGTKVEEPEDKSDGASQMDFLRETTEIPPTEDENEFKCKFCTKSFMKARSLRSHILTHNEAKPYRCKACDSCFSRYDHLKVHQARCKGKRTRLEIRIPKISLDDVGKGWQSRTDIKPPEKQETFECEVCLRSFPSQAKLSRHFTMFHAVKPFKCARCDSSFSHEKTLKKHRKDRKCRRQKTNDPFSGETNEPKEGAPSSLDGIRNRIILRIQPFLNKKLKYVCSYCPRAFKNSWQLHVHTRLHTGEKPYSCEYCGQRFMRKDYVPRHHLKCSKKPQPSKVLCDRCGGFFPEDKLENHKKNCALRPSSPTAPQSQKSSHQSPPKGFSCAYCSSRFLLFSQLQEHFLSAHKVETANSPASTAPLQQLLSNIPNIKEEPVEKSCGEGLSESGNLICKLDATLNNETPKEFVCQECNLSFSNKAGLTGHLRVHSTELPFNCSICKRGFWNKFLLRNHYRKCRPNTMQQLNVPLKAKIDFSFNNRSESFSADSKATTLDGDLETNISCKDASEDESPQTSEENQEQSSPRKEKKTVQYQCSECDKSFTDGLMLISHLEDHGREEEAKKQNKCTKCGRMFSSQGSLEKHMKLHGTNKNYRCNQCSKSFFTLSEVEKHKTSHDVTKPFSCKLCQQRFWTRPILCEHYAEDHKNEIFKCKFCSKVYAVKKSLSRHYKKWHPKEWKERWTIGLVKSSSSSDQTSSQVNTAGESDEDENNGSDSDSDSAPYFPCHVCGKTFPTSESLEDHQLCHLGEKPHECAECGKCFFLASQLQQHQRMHKSEFQCQTCGRGFVTLFALRNHKHTHGKNRPHRCSKCELSFTGPNQLAEHMSTHREESFPCDICNKIFQSKSSRVEHRKSHSKSGDNASPALSKEEQEQSESSLVYTSEFKYRCGVCSERFRDPEELSEHGCMEAKERPYSCIDCDKHFLHASHLKKHRNTIHLPSWSNREYPCNQCNSSFSSSQNFLNHLKSHVDATAGIKQEEETSDTLICPVCHQCFATATELIYHFPTHPDTTSERGKNKVQPSGSEFKDREHHLTSAAVYQCTDCGGKFLGRDAVRLHNCSHKQQAVKEGKSSNPSAKSITHQAAEEMDVDTDEEEEEEDVDVTGEDLHKCPDCAMQFSSKSSLLEHQNKRHTNGKRFKCERCGKSFAKLPYLKKHESRHRLKETVDIVVQPPPESKFRCAQCTARFETAQDLSVHMRLHAEKQAGEYRCDMCYKSFSQRSLLKQHQESHVGEVVYECTECDKAFAFPHLLEEHQQTHTDSLQ